MNLLLRMKKSRHMRFSSERKEAPGSDPSLRWSLQAFWHLRCCWTLGEPHDGITWLRNLYKGPNYLQP